MAVSQRILQREDLAEILRELKDIKPETIAQIEQARRKEAALTEAELAKTAEARAYLAKYDTLKDGIAREEAALAAARIEHTGNIVAHNKYLESEKTRLADWETQLNIIAAKREEAAKANTDASKAIDARSKKIEEDHVKWEADYQNRIAALATAESAQQKETERLVAEDKRLKAKAARIAAEAAS